MAILDSQVFSYTERVWESILGLKITQTNRPYQLKGTNQSLSACVHIMGSWVGTVALQCPIDLARKVASIMFSVKEEAADLEQIQDAMGELVNMTGGNIKSHLPEPCYLSLPAVAVTDHTLHIPGTEEVSTVNFECTGFDFSVTVLRRLS